MSGSVGRGVDDAMGQWKGLKEEAKVMKEMEGFFSKLMKSPGPRKKTKTKKKGGKKK
jgi:hypothetical protein